MISKGRSFGENKMKNYIFVAIYRYDLVINKNYICVAIYRYDILINKIYIFVAIEPEMKSFDI